MVRQNHHKRRFHPYIHRQSVFRQLVFVAAQMGKPQNQRLTFVVQTLKFQFRLIMAGGAYVFFDWLING